MMDLKENRQRLLHLYAGFETAVQPFVVEAVCRAGCADCCTRVGDVDMTTMEGAIVLESLQKASPAVREGFQKRLKKNRKEREESQYARCAFLLPDNTCSIYAVRPFSCRRLYSLKVCGETGPTVHRLAWQLAEETVRAIQGLDPTGYSGHMAFILQLLQDARFRKTYLSGGFAPAEIEAFARKHRIAINRFA